MFAEVAPLVGAWIEIYECTICHFPESVAPLVGAWIEIKSLQRGSALIMSLLL